MQPATTAQTNAINVPITAALRNFYQNISNKPSSVQAEGDVTKFNKSTPRSADILGAFDEAYGVNAQSQRVGDLRKSVMQAEDLVNNVDDNVFARTSNALVSDAQRARLTAAEKDPLTKQLGVISRNFDVANQDLSGLKETSNRYSSAELGDIDMMRGTLGQRLTTAQQREEVARQKRAEEQRQREWWKNYELQKRKTDAEVANLRAQSANTQRQYDLLSGGLGSLLSGGGSSKSAPQEKILKTHTKNGQILGYDTNQRSFLSTAGQAKEDKFWADRNKKPWYSGLTSALGNVSKTMTGWF